MLLPSPNLTNLLTNKCCAERAFNESACHAPTQTELLLALSHHDTLLHLDPCHAVAVLWPRDSGLLCRYDEFGRVKRKSRGGDDRRSREEAALARLRGQHIAICFMPLLSAC